MSLISYVSWWGVRVMEGDGEYYVCLPHRVLLLVKVDNCSHVVMHVVSLFEQQCHISHKA